MFCPFRKSDCSSNCVAFNLSAKSCVIKDSLDFYLYLTETILGANNIPLVDYSGGTICFIANVPCPGIKCVLWDATTTECGIIHAALNYQAQTDYLLSTQEKELENILTQKAEELKPVIEETIDKKIDEKFKDKVKVEEETKQVSEENKQEGGEHE